MRPGSGRFTGNEPTVSPLSGGAAGYFRTVWYVSSPSSSDVPAGPLSAMQRGAGVIQEEPHAHQVRGRRQERQAAQPRQREPPLQPLRGDPLRRAPAQQVLAQGRDGLQPRRALEKCFGRDAGWVGARGMRCGSASREAACSEAPVGGTFRFQIFIQTSSQEIWSQTISGSEEVPARK